jgi:hypothetical protein
MRPNNEKLGQAIDLYTDCGAIRQAYRATTLCKEDSEIKEKIQRKNEAKKKKKNPLIHMPRFQKLDLKR